MKEKQIKILAIETSCDETAVAVICGTNYSARNNNQETITKQISNANIEYPKIMSNVVSSQVDLHAKTGGIVPEVASRAHMESILPVIEEALMEGSRERGVGSKNKKLLTPYALPLTEITHIAVTAGPGLIGSLLVGFNTAKAMAYALDVPIIPINHIEGHIYSAFSGEISKSEFLTLPTGRQVSKKNHNDPKAKKLKSPEGTPVEGSYDLTPDSFPILALTVSGGHTSLTLMEDHGKYLTIGQTRDDAAGEAFDKVAKLLNLGYPGGPEVSRLAEKYRSSRALGEGSLESENPALPTPHSQQIVLPRPMINDKSFDFSFSGLKTAVLEVVRQLESQSVIASKAKQSIKKIATADDGLAMTDNGRLLDTQKAEICAAFEDAVVDVLCAKTLRAAEKYHPKMVLLAGGVAANKRLREVLSNKLKTNNYQLVLPPAELCGDNAAMIGLAAFYHIIRGDVGHWDEIKIDSNLML